MKKLLIALLLCPTLAFAQTSSLNQAKAVASTAPVSSWSIAGSLQLLGLTVSAPCPTGVCFVMVFDATSAPADGAVQPALCLPMPPPAATGSWSSTSMANTPTPVQVATGATVVYSTGSSCFSLTKSATAFISVVYQ